MKKSREKRRKMKRKEVSTHPGDAEGLMQVMTAMHAEAPRGAAKEGDFSGAHSGP